MLRWSAASRTTCTAWTRWASRWPSAWAWRSASTGRPRGERVVRRRRRRLAADGLFRPGHGRPPEAAQSGRCWCSTTASTWPPAASRPPRATTDFAAVAQACGWAAARDVESTPDALREALDWARTATGPLLLRVPVEHHAAQDGLLPRGPRRARPRVRGLASPLTCPARRRLPHRKPVTRVAVSWNNLARSVGETGRQPLECVPEHRIAAARLVHREVRLEHAPLGAELLDRELVVVARGISELLATTAAAVARASRSRSSPY